MSSLKLIWGTVNTFPPGAAPEEIEKLYTKHMVPVLKALYSHQAIQASFYFSGMMLDWLENQHSEFLSAFSELNQQRRVEVLGGGYFDPIFPVIPKLDRLGQIEHLTTRIRQLFGKRPRGAWLTNFFWEPEITSTLQSSGIEYTFLDDTFFTRAGMESRDLFYPAITEDQGKTLIVYPVSGRGRQLFWKSSPEEMIEYLLAQSSGVIGAERTIVLMYDCSINFPDCEDEASAKLDWLSRFLDLLTEAQEKGTIETIVPSRLRKRAGYMTRAYFEAPTLEEVHAASVGEPIPQLYADPQVLLPGINRLGYFAQKNVRHSLARYPEANLLYAKMQYLFSLVAQLRGDKFRKQASRESLWQAQNHNPYWHGPDGGLYRNRYRKTAYSQLIEAEKSTREKGIFAPGLIVLDFDFDGMNEYLFQGNEYNAYVHLKGGIVFELDYLLQPYNYADTCARHPEMYHLAAQETEGYDLYPRRLFVDHFIDQKVTMNEYTHANNREQGSFCQESYQVVQIEREPCRLVLGCEGTINCATGAQGLTILKSFEFLKHGLKVVWNLENRGSDRIDTIFIPEMNPSFSGTAVQDLRMFYRDGRAKPIEIAPEAQNIELCSEIQFQHPSNRTSMTLLFSQSLSAWSFPLETSVKTSNGFIREYQASVIVPRFPVSLAPGESFECSVEVSLLRLGSRTSS